MIWGNSIFCLRKGDCRVWGSHISGRHESQSIDNNEARHIFKSGCRTLNPGFRVGGQMHSNPLDFPCRVAGF